MENNWELKEEMDISWWHHGSPAYWENDEVYCSKCQERLGE